MCVCVFQAEYDAMLQEFAGEGIPLLASAAPAELFWPFLNELLPLITNKAVSLLITMEMGWVEGRRRCLGGFWTVWRWY